VDSERANSRRLFAAAVLLCVAGAGLALLAVTRPWGAAAHQSVPVGADRYPWLEPLALAALAGAGALVALGGVGRVLVGALLSGCGLGVVVGAVAGMADGLPVGWPLAALLGGLAIAAAGVLAAARGRGWPRLGARYARAAVARPGTGTLATWDALDRGEDPTVR